MVPPWGSRGSPQPGDLQPSDVINVVANHFGTTRKILVSPSRKSPLIAQRHLAMWLSYRLCPRTSLSMVARAFCRDHTTVLHAIKKMDRLKPESPLEIWQALLPQAGR